jgi:prevent-host-death family protein
MVRRMQVSEFRFAIREVVNCAENGDPTILTHYGRDAAVIVPMSMFERFMPPEARKPAVTTKTRNRKSKAS